jgi:hypothetical protein
MNGLTPQAARKAPSCPFEDIDWAHAQAPCSYLSLRYNQFGDQGVRELAGPHLTRFEALSLEGNGLGDEAALALATSPHLAQLTFLDLRSNKITARGVEALLGSPHLARLGFLALLENKVPVSGRKRIRARLRPLLTVWMEE